MKTPQARIDEALHGKTKIHIVPTKGKDMNVELLKAILGLYLFVFDNGLIYLKLSGYYLLISEDAFVSIVYSAMDADTRLLFKASQLLDCLQRLKHFPELQVEVNKQCGKSREYINIENGVYDVRNMKLVESTSSLVFDYKLELHYTPGCTLEQAENMWNFLISSLGQCNIECFRRMLAYCLSSLTKGRVCFLLIGKGKTGKSTALNLFERMVPVGLVSHQPFHTMASEQAKAHYRNMRINLSRDNSSVPMKHEEAFKSLVSSEMTTSRNLYEKNVDFVPTLKFIFASNMDLNFAHPDDAVYDRIVPLIFSREIPEDQRDLELEDKLFEERDIIFSWAMDSLGELIESNYDFCMSDESKRYLAQKRMELHTVPDFVSEMIVVKDDAQIASTKLFKAYEDWCNKNGLTSVGRNKFYGEVLTCVPTAKRSKVQTGNQLLQGFKGITVKENNAE